MKTDDMKKITLTDERVYKKWFAVAPGVWGIHDVFVNMYLIHQPAEDIRNDKPH